MGKKKKRPPHGLDTVWYLVEVTTYSTYVVEVEKTGDEEQDSMDAIEGAEFAMPGIGGNHEFKTRRLTDKELDTEQRHADEVVAL